MGTLDTILARLMKKPGEEPQIEEWTEGEKQLLRSLDKSMDMAHDAYMNIKILVVRLAKQNDSLNHRVARIEAFLQEVGNDDEDTNRTE